MTLPQPLLKHIDTKSFELVDLIKQGKYEKSEPYSHDGSIKEKISPTINGIDTSKPKVVSFTDSKGVKKDMWLEEGEMVTGFDEESYKIYSAFINSLYKKREFKSVVGRNFLFSKIFDWLIQTYKNKQAANNLSEYIIQEIEKSIKTKVYCFPILYFDISFFMQIGPVTIKYFTESNFDEMDTIYERIHGYKREGSHLRDKYQGMVVASVEVTAESERAKEIAFEKCALAVDILKIYSRTLFEPDIRLDFDIDARAKTQMNNLIFAHKNGSMENFTISMSRIYENAEVGENNIQPMKDLHFPIMATFVFNDGEKNELSKMLVNAISNFADALSTKNLHKRIAELFTIFESLLVPNETIGILHSLTTYAPKLITDNPEMRKDLKKLFKSLYSVRSSLMHHGKHQDFEMEDLRKLQYTLLCLILGLIAKSQTHQKKSDVLEEIDEAINRA